MAALQELDGGSRRRVRATDILVFMQDGNFIPQYLEISDELRAAGFACELYPEEKKLAQQFAYAEKKGIPLGIIAGQREIEGKTVNYKNLIRRQSVENISLKKAISLAAEDLKDG